jgi:hypothetical protein
LSLSCRRNFTPTADSTGLPLSVIVATPLAGTQTVAVVLAGMTTVVGRDHGCCKTKKRPWHGGNRADAIEAGELPSSEGIDQRCEKESWRTARSRRQPQQ